MISSMEKEVENATSVEIRIAVTATSGTGALIAGTILTILLTNKAYKSILQRLFMWTIIAIFLNDLFQFGAIYHDFSHGQTQIQLLQDNACKILGFLEIWAHWWQYLFVIDLVLYILVIVCIQTRDDSAFIAKVRTSKLLRGLLEFAVVLATLFLPLLIMWVPFLTHHYGFTGEACALKKHSDAPEVVNFTNQTSTSGSNTDLVITWVFKYVVVISTVAITIFSTLVIQWNLS